MRKQGYLILSLLMIIFVSCEGGNILIKPEFQNKSFANAQLFITGDFDEDCVIDEEYFKDVGFELSKLEYCGILKNELTESLISQSNFKNIDSFYDQKTKSNFKPQALLLNKDETIIIHLPEKSIETNLQGDVFLLVFENLEMTFTKKKFESSSPAKYYNATGGNAPNDLKVHNIKYFDYLVEIKSDFAIVHNNTSKVVSFGKIKRKAKHQVPNSVQKTIIEASQEVIKDILRETPFQKIN